MRKPNLPAALVDLGFAVAAAIIGATGAGWAVLGGLIFVHLAAWAALRRAGLQATSRVALPRTLAISIALIVAVDAIAFLIGSVFN